MRDGRVHYFAGGRALGEQRRRGASGGAPKLEPLRANPLGDDNGGRMHETCDSRVARIFFFLFLFFSRARVWLRWLARDASPAGRTRGGLDTFHNSDDKEQKISSKKYTKAWLVGRDSKVTRRKFSHGLSPTHCEHSPARAGSSSRANTADSAIGTVTLRQPSSFAPLTLSISSIEHNPRKILGFFPMDICMRTYIYLFFFKSSLNSCQHFSFFSFSFFFYVTALSINITVNIYAFLRNIRKICYL